MMKPLEEMMPAPATTRKFPRFADVLDRVGHVPANRILTDPAPGTATETDLLDPAITNDRGCELIDGILVEKPMGFREDLLGTWIIILLSEFLKDHDVGMISGPQGGIRFRVGLVMIPDVAFIRWDSVDDPDEIEEPGGAFLEYPPDLAVEVLSPSNTPKEMAIKLNEYARAGVKLVWYVDPQRQEVAVYPKARERGKRVLGLDGVLSGGDVLPGFELPVARIFEKRAPAKKKPKKGK